MHLVKWIRKNMRKIMVFVIIAIMGAFVLGSGVKYIFDSVFDPRKSVEATYDAGEKIRWSDTQAARNELQVLRGLMADQLLMAQSANGLSGPLLVHLLFPDSPFASQLAPQMKQAALQGQLPISLDELEDFFQQRPERPEILWLLLKAEAHQAGCAVLNESAAQTLRSEIPRMTGNQRDAAMLVSEIISRSNVSEEQILRIFSDLMSVLSYAGNVMNNQAVTINQVKASLGRSRERIDAEFVKIEADPFIDKDADITDAQIQQQFDMCKANVPGLPTEENPFGFGYKLAKRIQLEYMIISMDDVKKQIEKPTADAAEEYYSRNIAQFQKEVLSDPNDPESEKTTQPSSFAEVEALIHRTLEAEKSEIQANILFNEIKDKTEAKFETLNFEEASVAELQKAAGDFVVVADELSKKYNVPISVGKTGWLDATAFGQDQILSRIALRRGQNTLQLSDLAFAAAEEKSKRQRIGVPSVRVWENIGPLNGAYYSEQDKKVYYLMALVRVVGIKEAAVPDDVNATFDTKGVVLGDQPAQDDSSFSPKDQVKDDIRLLAAINAANARAQELAAMVTGSGWDDAIVAYNAKYAKTEDDPNKVTTDDQRIELDTIKQQPRVSQGEIEKAKRFMLENPGLAQRARQWLTSSMLTHRLYALLPEETKSTGTIQTVLAFDPQRACYVIKEVVRQPATMSDYMDNKVQTALQLNAAETAPLALVHFSPENILERMAFVRPKQEQEQEPAEQPEEPTTDNEEN